MSEIPVKSEPVRDMFGGIAGRYDLANRTLSMGLDILWRRRLVREVTRLRPTSVVDLATGSGDVAFALRKKLPPQARLQALDFCEPMLDQARRKQGRLDPSETLGPLSFAQGDCLNLPLDDQSADAATIAFGLRNLEDRARGLAEMRRILRPGGTLFVLEFTQPHRWFRPIYLLYLKAILPTLAGWITRQPSAYRYLAGTIESFPTVTALTRELEAAGFPQVRAIPMSLSIVALHLARKP